MKKPLIVDSVELAEYVAQECHKRGKDVGITKINKLLWIIYGVILANNLEKEIIINEKPKAWPFGPVFPRVQHKARVGHSCVTCGAIEKTPEHTKAQFSKMCCGKRNGS